MPPPGQSARSRCAVQVDTVTRESGRSLRASVLALPTWWESLRTVTGIVASIGFGVGISRAFALPLVGGLAFGGGWGLVLLHAVQLRSIMQGDGAASWSGVIAASMAYALAATSVIIGIGHIPVVLDLSTIPLGAIYIAAKLGCHRIGCCNW